MMPYKRLPGGLTTYHIQYVGRCALFAYFFLIKIILLYKRGIFEKKKNYNNTKRIAEGLTKHTDLAWIHKREIQTINYFRFHSIGFVGFRSYLATRLGQNKLRLVVSAAVLAVKKNEFWWQKYLKERMEVIWMTSLLARSRSYLAETFYRELCWA